MAFFKPLGLVVAFILFTGLIFPFILGYFMPVESIELSPFSASLVTIVSQGFEVASININPFSLLGDTLHAELTKAVTYLGLLPDFILISVLIMLVVAIVFIIFTLIRGN